MKRISAIVRPSKLEAVKEALFEAGCAGMTITQVYGCGSQHGWTEYVRGSEINVNMLMKTKFEIIVNDSDVDKLVDVICESARTGEVGDGKIFISDVESVIRVRTGERDGEAV